MGIRVIMRSIITSLLLTASLLLAVGTEAQTTSVTLGWTPSTSSNVAGYDIYYGTSSGNYITAVPVSTVTNVTINGLISGQKYYFAATSYDSSGNVSPYSPEISYTVGITSSPAATITSAVASPTGQFTFSVSGATGFEYIVQGSTDLVHWVSLQTNYSPFNFVDSNAKQYSQRFYRTASVSN
jgi:hypothetical protein